MQGLKDGITAPSTPWRAYALGIRTEKGRSVNYEKKSGDLAITWKVNHKS